MATLHERPRYAAYNISHGEAVTLNAFADAVRDVLPGARLEIGPGLDDMQLGVQYYAALDNARARDDLGFVPRFGLREGIADYVRRTRAPLPQ